MDYLKKSLKNLDLKKDYEEIDTRIASGWYVDDLTKSKKKIYQASNWGTTNYCLSSKSWIILF